MPPRETEVPFLLQPYSSQQHCLWQRHSMRTQKRERANSGFSQSLVSWKSHLAIRGRLSLCPHLVPGQPREGDLRRGCGHASFSLSWGGGGWHPSWPFVETGEPDLGGVSWNMSRESPTDLIAGPHGGRARVLVASVPTPPDKE